MSSNYWFRPARFWKYFAFYYPSSKEGWVIVVILSVLAVLFSCVILIWADSRQDLIIGFGGWFIALGAIFDILCFRRGEYPSWWRKKKR